MTCLPYQIDMENKEGFYINKSDIMVSYSERRAEKILLIAAFAKIVFEGDLLRQEPPRCCGVTVDLIANAMHVYFREIAVGRKTINLLEPLCPVCGRRIMAVYSIIQ
jgi:hypothetical protein